MRGPSEPQPEVPDHRIIPCSSRFGYKGNHEQDGELGILTDSLSHDS